MLAVPCLCVLWLFASVAADQDAQVPQQELNLRAFVMSAYPDLAGKPIQIEMVSKGVDADVVVTEVHRDLARPDRSTDVPLLRATVQFADGSRVRSFTARGPFLEDDRNQTLSQLVRRAKLAGDDVNAVIAENVRTFGPEQRDAARAKVALIRLHHRLGTMQIGTVSAVAPPPDTRYGFVWEVLAQDDLQRTYILTVEPYGGRLISAKEQQ